jgi:hypothetical protein
MASDLLRTGRAVVQVYMNLMAHPYGPTHAALDATRRAGAATDLMFRLRGNGPVLSQGAVEQFGQFSSLSPRDLSDWCLPALAAEDVLDVVEQRDGYQVEERIGVAAPVLEVTTRLVARFDPSPVEACALASAELAGTIPMIERDHRDALIAAGHAEQHHAGAVKHLRAIGLLHQVRSSSGGDAVLYSPHVWGAEAVDIARFISRLPPAEREQLIGLADAALMRPGLPTSHLRLPSGLLRGARKVGLIDGARVHTPTGERLFAFPPDLDNRFGLRRSDAAHERKLFIAHILNGHFFGVSRTGRINDPLVLVDALINRGTVGPATAIGRDYPLLESAGIVRAREARGGQYYLDLVKRDVAEDSRTLLARALEGGGGQHSAGSLNALWLPGSFQGPERDRSQLQVTAAQAEVFDSALLNLREQMQRRRRGEEFS